jgi:hypothetical protein
VEVAVRLGTETGVGIEHGGRDRIGEGSGGVAGSGEGSAVTLHSVDVDSSRR